MDIELKNISLSFGEKRIFSGFNARFPEGEISCVMGPSGCGKTTLLNLVMGLLRPDTGEVRGVPERFGAVFQEDRLCEDFRAASNIRLVCGRGVSEAEINEALVSLGLGDSLRRPVREFSGGMKRRVAIVRALLYGGGAVFMDEPFKGLDEATRARVAGYIKARLSSRTAIIVTHDPAEAEALGARVLRLEAP